MPPERPQRCRSLERFWLPCLLRTSVVLGCVLQLGAATVQVTVGDGGTKFSPQSVSIQVGDTVEWDWKSSGHSSTSGVPGTPDGMWDSGVQNDGFIFKHTFSAPGTFSYYCTPHGLCCGMTGSVSVAAPTPTPTPPLPPIAKGTIGLQLLPVAGGLTAPIDLSSANDSSGRSFVVEQTGKVLILKNGVISSTPFLDVSSRLVTLMPNYDERGLLGLAFHPDFNSTGTAGYHRIYTYTSEPVAGPADFTVPNANAFDHQSVIAEWQVSSANADAIDPATRREILRIDEPQFNHNGGHLSFRASDHYLYISLGDGGNANDVGSGHNPTTGNAQDKSTVLGKILRIDPRDPALTSTSADRISANGKYRVPASNPFVGQTGTVAEIYALGLRNPYRFTFDAISDQLLIGDVGQNNIEEVDIAAAGKNYGWNRKEGTFLFNPADGSVSKDPAPDPTFTDPVAEYCHVDGSAVIAGFIYRGSLVPALSGKYLFGDLAKGTSGRLFYTDLATGAIQEPRLGSPDRSLGLFLKGFGADENGEIYVLADAKLGPSGSGGEIFQVTTIPLISSIGRSSGGNLLISGTAAPNSSVDIQATSDLMTAFQTIKTVSANANGVFQFEDTSSSTVVTRFYRVSLPAPGTGGATPTGPSAQNHDGRPEQRVMFAPAAFTHRGLTPNGN